MVIYAPPINNMQAYPQNTMYNAGYNSPYSNNMGYNNNTTSVFNNNTSNYYQNYNTNNYITPPANNTTNIFNNYIPQPSVMTPQATPQIVVAVPTAAPQQQPVQANTPSSNETAMKFMLLMMTMLLGKNNKTDEANNTDTDTTETVIKENKMTALDAANILKKNFILYEHINDTKKGRLDGKASWDEVSKYAQQTDNEKFKEAYKYFNEHPDEFHVMENTNSGDSTLNDFIFTEDELQKYIDKLS